MRYATLCSGIEGFGLGFDDSGMECVYQCEIDKDCRRVLERHYPGADRGTDVNDETTAESLRRLRPDLLAFGFPCQDLSVAGRRAGLAGKRSGLFFRCADLIAQFSPRWLCIENVPGLLSSNDGRDMGIVLGTVGDLGYGWAYRVLDAQWFGVAQRRRRVFIVGCLGDAARAAEILFERDSLPWNPPPSRETGARVAGCFTAGAHPGGHNGQDDHKDGRLIVTPVAIQERACSENLKNGPGGKGWQEHIAFTLEARHHAQTVAYRTSGNCGVMEQGDRTACLNTATDPTQNIIRSGMAVRRLTPCEYERLQGFPDGWTRIDASGKELSDASRYRMLGNAVCVNVARWVGKRLKDANSGSLTSQVSNSPTAQANI